MQIVSFCLFRNLCFSYEHIPTNTSKSVCKYQSVCRRIISTSTKSPATLQHFPIFAPRLFIVHQTNKQKDMIQPNEVNSPPDPQDVNMGKSIRIIREHLCNLFYNPLPSDILAPTITLEFLPAQFPELPRANGKLAYVAAMKLMQISGAPKQLSILSERVVDRKMTVKWEAATAGSEVSQWMGWFYFTFDESGLVSKQVIENVERPFNDQSGGNKLLGWTKWLLKQWGSHKLRPAWIKEMKV